MSEVAIRVARTSEVDPATLYRLLALRVEVFVVEQACAYQDLDGRDLEPGTCQLWAELDGAIVGTSRILDEPDGSARIGRVVTAPGARHAGVGAALVRAALARCAERPVVLHAQAHLVDWYTTFGFVRDGADEVEDGILHTPMRLAKPTHVANAHRSA